MEGKTIKHYSSNQKILLVGEGDFSFSLCLAKAFGSASNLVATSLDSRDSLISNYSRASSNLFELECLGCTVVHKVDAHTMHTHPSLKNIGCFDRIVYNFPHAGFKYSEDQPRQIELHQHVVLGFLKSARKMVSEGGEVHVTHKTTEPFCDWEVEKLAEVAGFFLVEKVTFNLRDYPGYVNKRGSGYDCDGTFPVGDSSTFKFSKAPDIFEALIAEFVMSQEAEADLEYEIEELSGPLVRTRPKRHRTRPKGYGDFDCTVKGR